MNSSFTAMPIDDADDRQRTISRPTEPVGDGIWRSPLLEPGVEHRPGENEEAEDEHDAERLRRGTSPTPTGS